MHLSILERYKSSGRITPAELKGAPKGDLLELKIIIDQEIAHIASNLLEASSKAASGGGYSDVGWYRQAKLAKSIKGGISQRIQLELGRQRREAREANSESGPVVFRKYLLDAMDIVISTEQKERIIAKARELQQDAGVVTPR